MTIKDEADLMVLALPPLSDRLLPAVPVKEEVKITEEPTARTLEPKKKDKTTKEPKVKKAKSKPETHESGQDLKPKKMPVKKAGGSMPPPEPAEGPRAPVTPPDLLLEADRKRQRVAEPEPERATPTEAATQRSEASSSKDKEFVRRWKEREERSPSMSVEEDSFEDVPIDLPSVTHPCGSRQIHITLPNGKRRLSSVKQPVTLSELVEKYLPAVGDFYFLLNGLPAQGDEAVYHDPDLEAEPPFRLSVQARGRGGGVAQDDQVKLKIERLLESKGLSGKELSDKTQTTMDLLDRAEKTKFAEAPDPWKTLKNLVGTRITFLKRTHRESQDSHPWKEAMKARTAKSPGKDATPPTIKLIPEAFVNSDGSTPPLLDNLCNGATGITLLSPPTLREWMDAPMPLSADELSAIVFPPITPDVQIPSAFNATLVEFPVVIQSEQETTSLLRGHLVHFGSKQVTLAKPTDQVTLTTQDAVSLMVEILKDQCPDWDRMTPNPMQYLTMRLKGTKVASHWGARWWGKGGKTTTPTGAERFTTNLLIPKDEVKDVLRGSGTAGTWFSPRAGQPQYDLYGVLWTPGSLQEVRISHDKLASAAGVVRSRKGYGIRVLKDDMQTAKQMLFPGIPFPPTLSHGIDPELLFKLSPTPLGAGREDVQAYLDKQTELENPRVVRQVGPKGWLVTFAKPPTILFLHSGGNHLILQKWVTRGERDPLRAAVIVGVPAAVKAAAAFMSPFPTKTIPSLPDMQPRPPPVGPTQEKFSQLEQKLTRMVEDVRNGYKDDIKALGENQEAQIKELRETTQAEVAKLRQDHSNAYEELKTQNQEVRTETNQKMEALDRNMSNGFQQLMEEFHRMKQKDLKRTASPSPDEDRTKSLKN